MFLTRNVKYICLVLKCRSDVFVLFEDVKLKILLEKFLEKLIKMALPGNGIFVVKGEMTILMHAIKSGNSYLFFIFTLRVGKKYCVP